MATVSPEPQTMDRTLAPQPKLADNGCCCHCCGKAPGPIDAANITRDGGKYIQHADGRVVEYFVYGAADGDRVMLQINGSMGTGWLPANTELNVAKLKELNVKGVSITIPGYGYTSLFPKGYRLGDWPKMDVEPVLAAEGLAGKPLAVEGTSYGAGIALAVAAHFGERVSHLHLHVPYINSELRKELGFPLKIGDDGFFDKDFAWADSCACDACCLYGALGCVYNCCGVAALHDDETKKMEAAAPGSTAAIDRDLMRGARNGANLHGLVHNCVGELISKNWGFDTRKIAVQNMKVMVSYNMNDSQTGSREMLPENPHGKWLAEHFTSTATVCQVNIGGSEAKGAPNQHGAQMAKTMNGEFVAQLLAL